MDGQSSELPCADMMDGVDTFTIWRSTRRTRDVASAGACFTNASMSCAGPDQNALLLWSPTITSAAPNFGSVAAGRKFLVPFRWELTCSNFRDWRGKH